MVMGWIGADEVVYGTFLLPRFVRDGKVIRFESDSCFGTVELIRRDVRTTSGSFVLRRTLESFN